MNSELKKEIKAAFELPEPKGKEQFFKNFRFPKISRKDFIFEQIFYIGKEVWIVSVLILALMILAIGFSGTFSSIGSGLWIISSLMPFLALVSIMELSRSTTYKMAEIEAGCRFGLHQLLLARMLLLGAGNGLIILTTAIVSKIYLPEGIIKIAVYLLAPYLLVCGSSLCFMNHTKNRNNIYACTAIAAMISILGITGQRILQNFGDEMSLCMMVVVLLTGLMTVIVQIRKIYKNLEEGQWNFA